MSIQEPVSFFFFSKCLEESGNAKSNVLLALLQGPQDSHFFFMVIDLP